MTGGEIYVYDDAGRLERRLNDQLVAAHRPGLHDLDALRSLLERHVRYTGSARAEALLESWETVSPSFSRIAPKAEVARLQSAYEGTMSGS
jgi:glutamate synthase (NADPH) large chain